MIILTKVFVFFLLLLISSTQLCGETQIPNQSNWVNKGVVLSNGPPGAWDVRLHGMISPCAVIKKNGIFFLYYIGADGNRHSDGGPRHRALGVAFSSNGIKFKKFTQNPVITYLPTQGEEEGIFSCAATLDNHGDIYLFYGAMRAKSYTSVNMDIRLAVSSNGFNFSEKGIVIDHSDSSIWGYGDELGPLGATKYNDKWYVYYGSFNGKGTKWDLGVAWGTSPNDLNNTTPFLTEKSYIIGGADVNWVGSDTMALFIVRDFRKGVIEVRNSYMAKSPGKLSNTIKTYYFGFNWRHATVYFDYETNTWYMFHRKRKGNNIYLRIASP